jgi:type III secretory pathway component EscV
VTTTPSATKIRRGEEEKLSELLQYFPDDNVEEIFVRDIQELITEKNLSCLDAVIHWAEKRGIEDVTMLVGMIRKNRKLMSKITVDAENLNFIKKVPRLAI